MDILIPLFLQIFSAVIGGNLAGAVIKKHSLGFSKNALLGIHGGGLGVYILSFLSMNIGGTIYGSMFAGLAGGFIAGIVLLVTFSLLKYVLRLNTVAYPTAECH